MFSTSRCLAFFLFTAMAVPCQGDIAIRRGDANGNGSRDFTDAIGNLSYQFLGTFDPTCIDALDYDDSGSVDLADPIR
jgi:hypothetical protein